MYNRAKKHINDTRKLANNLWTSWKKEMSQAHRQHINKFF